MSAALVTSVSALLFVLPVDHISLGIRSDMLIEYISLGIRSDMLIEYKRKKACLLYIFWELKISTIASNYVTVYWLTKSIETRPKPRVATNQLS